MFVRDFLRHASNTVNQSNLLGALWVGDPPVVDGDVVLFHWVTTFSRGPVTGHAPAALGHDIIGMLGDKKCYFRTWTSRTPTVKRNVESVSRNNKERNPISRRKNYLIIQTYKLFLCLMFKSFTWITKCRRMKPLTRANVTSSDPSCLLSTSDSKSFWYFPMSQKIIRRRIRIDIVISRLKIFTTCPYL